jgi:hypothetical protein
MTSSPEKRLRILVMWGAAHFDDFLPEFLLTNPKYDIEIVSGDVAPAMESAAAAGARRV